MVLKKFFYDSYAVLEYLRNNPDYYPYFEEAQGFLTIFNLVEIYYSLLTSEGKEVADKALKSLYPLVIEPSPETIQKSMAFRTKHRHQKLSYADCIGYEMASERDVSFLTGDKEFRNFPNVTFVPVRP